LQLLTQRGSESIFVLCLDALNHCSYFATV
jgi:hypothetical protein